MKFRDATLLALLTRFAWPLGIPPCRAASAPTVGASEVPGDLLPALHGRETASIRAFAVREGRVVPAAIQVDERDQEKRRIVIEGPSPIVDESPGVFDPSDEIVFLNRDLGARAERNALPAGAGRWTEVRVGPNSDPVGYLYLTSFDHPPPTPKGRACRYEPQEDRVYAERYSVRFGAALPTELGFAERLGDRGTDVLKSVRARGRARILGIFDIARTEKDMQAQLHGTHDGPVRCVRTAKYSIRMPLGFKARGRVDLLFYRDFVEGRGKVNVRIPPRFVPATGELAAYFDFRDLTAARLLEPVTEVSTIAAGARKSTATVSNTRWAALLLPDGRTFLLVVRLGGSLARLDQRIYYRSGPQEAGTPSFGFELSGAERLDTGEQLLSVVAGLLDTSEPESVRRAADILLSPPPISTKEIR